MVTEYPLSVRDPIPAPALYHPAGRGVLPEVRHELGTDVCYVNPYIASI